MRAYLGCARVGISVESPTCFCIVGLIPASTYLEMAGLQCLLGCPYLACWLCDLPTEVGRCQCRLRVAAAPGRQASVLGLNVSRNCPPGGNSMPDGEP